MHITGQSCPSLTTNNRTTTQASHQMHQSQDSNVFFFVCVRILSSIYLTAFGPLVPVRSTSSPTNRQPQRIENNRPRRVSQGLFLFWFFGKICTTKTLNITSTDAYTIFANVTFSAHFASSAEISGPPSASMASKPAKR